MKLAYRTGDLVIDRSTGRLVVILGNSETEHGKLWCAEWDTLKSYDANTDDLVYQCQIEKPDWNKLISRMEDVASNGDSDAMWWCAWAYEGINHPRSVWYYIAAMRRSPQRHGWALERVWSDAHSGYMCKGVPKPDLSFLGEIEEFQDAGRWGDWKSAVLIAANSIHTPAHVSIEEVS